MTRSPRGAAVLGPGGSRRQIEAEEHRYRQERRWAHQYERRAAFETLLATGSSAELRALGTGTDSAGGVLVPEVVVDQLHQAMQRVSAVRWFASLSTSRNGEPRRHVTVDETGVAGELIGENVETAEADPVFDALDLKPYLFSSKEIRLPFSLAEDAGMPLTDWLIPIAARRISRAEAPFFINGTGTNQPEGLLPGATVGVTAAATTTITRAELLDLEVVIDADYREPMLDLDTGEVIDRTGWIMNDTTWRGLEDLTDSAGAPLVDVQAPVNGRRTRRTLLGYPVRIDPNMPDPAAGTKPILFGNFWWAYRVLDVEKPHIVVTTERYIEQGQIGAIVFQRTDAGVQDPSAYTALQMAAV